MKILNDLRDQIDLMIEHGAYCEDYSMDVPLRYAELVHAELMLSNINLPYPETGCEVLLELANRGKVRLQVH